MKVIFVFKGSAGMVPSGGARIAIDYANYLAEQGYNVEFKFVFAMAGKRYVCKDYLKYLLYRLKLVAKRALGLRWLAISGLVTKKYLFKLTAKDISNADVVIATAWQTARLLSGMVLSESVEKLYLVQHYETWDGEIAEVERTYSCGLKNIVVSRWLEKTLKSKGHKVFAYIPNGIAMDVFKCFTPFQSRKIKVGMVYHEALWKNCKLGIDAIKKVKQAHSEIEVEMVGGCKRPESLPEWIKYICNPSQDELVDYYNSLRVFVSSSDSEGFGLPGAEAMACGCALATTDSGGVMDYAEHEKTALVSAPGNLMQLSANIGRLLLEQDTASTLAACGRERINAGFCLKNSRKYFAEVLTKALNN